MVIANYSIHIISYLQKVNGLSVTGFLKNPDMALTVLLLQILNMEQDGRVLTVLLDTKLYVLEVNFNVCLSHLLFIPFVYYKPFLNYVALFFDCRNKGLPKDHEH